MRLLSSTSSVSTIITALCCLVSLGSGVHGWTTPSHPTNNNNQVSRQSVLQTLMKGGVVTAASIILPSISANTVPYALAAGDVTTTLPNGVTYEVVQVGKGPKPEMGELAAIRFAAYYGDRKIDDIFDTPEPYYTVSTYITTTTVQ
jgi:hypothetical protein